MSFQNPFADQLKDDDARAHWNEHVVCDEGMHHQHRAARALSAGRSHAKQLDAEFAVWFRNKKLKGFANFDTSPICAE